MFFDTCVITVNCEEMSRKYLVTPIEVDTGYLFKITCDGDFKSVESSLEDCVSWCETDAMNGGCKFE